MLYTFKGLRDTVLRLIDEYTETDEHTEQLAKDLMNAAEERRCVEYRWPFLKFNATLTTVIGQRDYALHPEWDRPIDFRIGETHLIEVPDRQIVGEGHSVTGSGSAARFQIRETWPVAVQPSAASVLTIVSDSNLDTGLEDGIAIKGEVAGGFMKAEILVPNGLTPVTGGVAFTKILSVTKAQAWNGNMTLSAGATPLLVLMGCEMGRQHRVLHLLEEPTGAEVIDYSFYRTPLPMVNDYDVPSIPAPYSQVLIWDTLLSFQPYLQSLQTEVLNEWRGHQARLESAMLTNLMAGQSLAAAPRTVRRVA